MVPCTDIYVSSRLINTSKATGKLQRTRGRTCIAGVPGAGAEPHWKQCRTQTPNQFSSMQVDYQGPSSFIRYPMAGERSPRQSPLGIRLMRDGSGGVSCPERVSRPTWMRDTCGTDRCHSGNGILTWNGYVPMRSLSWSDLFSFQGRPSRQPAAKVTTEERPER